MNCKPAYNFKVGGYMTIEIALVISALSLIFAVYSGVTSMKRSAKYDDTKEATELTTVIVKLENISNGIAEIKNEMGNIKIDVKDLRNRLIIVEQSLKQAHKRIDTLEGRVNAK